MEGKVLGIPLAILLLVFLITGPILSVQSLTINRIDGVSERISRVETVLSNQPFTTRPVQTPETTASATATPVAIDLESDNEATPTPTEESVE